jgi:uncharacterized protein (TIGR02145 family)
MKSQISILIFVLFVDISYAQSGSITNVTASQRTDGSMLVDVYYDLAGPEPQYVVKAEFTHDNYDIFFPIYFVSGDVGPDITTGTAKHIVWNFGAQYPDVYNNTIKVRVMANVADCFNFVDTRDYGLREYNVVQIGSQCWMAENLNYGTMISGTDEMTDNNSPEKYCYDDNPQNCNVYGGLYQWNEMMQYVSTPGTQGICLEGWHLPTNEEWCQLLQTIDPTVDCNAVGIYSGTVVGTQMKSTFDWNNGGNGTNESGFNALPGGYRTDPGGSGFIGRGVYAVFYSSTQFSNPVLAWFRTVSYLSTGIDLSANYKYYGHSVRCIKN